MPLTVVIRTRSNAPDKVTVPAEAFDDGSLTTFIITPWATQTKLESWVNTIEPDNALAAPMPLPESTKADVLVAIIELPAYVYEQAAV